MIDIFIDSNKKHDESDIAMGLACEKFEEKHPKEMWPKWLSKCISVSGTKNQNKKWLIEITVMHKIELEPNQHWEERRGNLVLVKVDPITGKKSIVISGGPAVTVDVLFKVEVDSSSHSVTVIKDTDINILDGTIYEIRR